MKFDMDTVRQSLHPVFRRAHFIHVNGEIDKLNLLALGSVHFIQHCVPACCYFHLQPTYDSRKQIKPTVRARLSISKNHLNELVDYRQKTIDVNRKPIFVQLVTALGWPKFQDYQQLALNVYDALRNDFATDFDDLENRLKVEVQSLLEDETALRKMKAKLEQQQKIIRQKEYQSLSKRFSDLQENGWTFEDIQQVWNEMLCAEIHHS